jgi:hypothetical protein
MWRSLFNANYVDVDKLSDLKTRLSEKSPNNQKQTNKIHLSPIHSENGETQESLNYTSTIVDNNMTLDNLRKLVTDARKDTQSNTKLKIMLRNNNWSFTHKIRRYLWLYMLELNKVDDSVRTEYLNDLNNIFGQGKKFSNLIAI